jgi:hypothetical protein
VQSWALSLLETNAADEGTLALYVEEGSVAIKQVSGLAR